MASIRVERALPDSGGASVHILPTVAAAAAPDQGESADSATFAICVCAYNEERVIERKIQNLLEIKRREPRVEILVYVDAATDRTADLLRQHRGAINLFISPQRHGKTHGMNLLAERATASILVFSDANVMLETDMLAKLRHRFADPAIGCVCGHLHYTNALESATAEVGSLYWRLEERIKQLESETGSTMGADGSLFAIRRALHQPVPDHLIDDMFVSLAILCEGYRVISAPEIKAYEASVTVSGEEFRRKIRIACQAFNVHRILWPRLSKLGALTLYKYISHKYLRWLAIYFLVAAILCFEAGMVLAGLSSVAIALTGAGILVLALGQALKIKPVPEIYNILTAFLGTGIGVWNSLRGKLYQTWTPAGSIRN